MAYMRARSWWLPDTTLHRLNGSLVVNIVDVNRLFEASWLSPDEADAFADSLKAAAALARQGRETDDTDEEE